MNYRYFVSYTTDCGSFGHAEVVLDGELDCFNDIKLISEHLAKQNSHTRVIILNYQLMGTEEE